MPLVSLQSHPATPEPAISAFHVELRQAPDGWRLRYMLEGEMAKLALPAAGELHRGDQLWERTCFEAFISGPGVGYYEWNFAPSRAWSVYAFTGYRLRTAALADDAAPVELLTRSTPQSYELEALVRPRQLAGLAEAETFDVGLAAVIENNAQLRSYWALGHGVGGPPDFHDRRAFKLRLARECA